MTMWTSLDPADVTVEPGTRTSARLRVRNTGDTVEEYRLSLVGKPSGWSRVEPDILRLYPGSEGTAEISFAPPRSPDVAAGPLPYGIRVEPRENAAARDIVEGRLTVTPFTEVRAELLPPALTGRFRGRARVAVDNLGNTPLTASLLVRDEGNRLTFDMRPNAVQIAPGRAAFGDLVVRPQTVRWTGGEESHRFTVAVRRSGDDTSLDLDAGFDQRPVLGAWLMVAAGLLVTGVIAFVALWMSFSPKITSAAKETRATGAPAPLPQGDGDTLPDAPPPPSTAGTPPPGGNEPGGGGDLPPGDGGSGAGGGGSGGGSASGGSGGGTGGDGQAPPPPSARREVPPWGPGYPKDVVVEFAQLRLAALGSKNDCTLKGSWNPGVIDGPTRASLVCYQRKVVFVGERDGTNTAAILKTDDEGMLGRATLTSLWAQGITPDEVKSGSSTWENTALIAAFWWAINRDFTDPGDMDRARNHARLGIEHFRSGKDTTTTYSSNVADHIRTYQRAVGLPVTGTADWKTLNAMVGGSVK